MTPLSLSSLPSYFLFQIGLYRQTFPNQVSKNVAVNQWPKREEESNGNANVRRSTQGLARDRKAEKGRG